MQKAVNQVIEKQTALRLQFVEREGKVYQYRKEYSYEEIPVQEFESKQEFETYASTAFTK